jgi:formyl-CoA transferase
MAARNGNRDTLIPAMQQVTATRSTAEWIALLEDKAVPCGPINDIAEAFADPQVVHRGLKLIQAVAPVEQAKAATKTIATLVTTVASPLRLQDTPPVCLRPPPKLGAHTDAVLAQLGLSPADRAALRLQKVI